MADETRALRQQLLAMVNSFMLSQALYAFTVLGLADMIGDGRRAATELAATVNADPTAVKRLLRALAAAGVLDEDDQGGFALTRWATASARTRPARWRAGPPLWAARTSGPTGAG